jgi:formylglycine-generating enzyme required for sulfatase activity
MNIEKFSTRAADSVCRNRLLAGCNNLFLLLILLAPIAAASIRGQQKSPLKIEEFKIFLRDSKTSLQEILEIAQETGVGFDIDTALEDAIIKGRGKDAIEFISRIRAIRRKTVRLVSMVPVPPGRFLMGSAKREDESPRRELSVAGFYLDKYEVTNAEYSNFLHYIAVTGDHRMCHPNEPSGKNHVPLYWNDSTLNQPNLPVVGIDWFDAYAYAAWVGARLPTEPEWERAARGNLVASEFPWGDEPPEGRACQGGIPLNSPCRVGSYPPNSLGLFDMAGNVWEWVDGWYSPTPGSGAEHLNLDQPSGRTRVVRGGSWASSTENLRCAFRADFTPTFRAKNIGFRCAISQ